MEHEANRRRADGARPPGSSMPATDRNSRPRPDGGWSDNGHRRLSKVSDAREDGMASAKESRTARRAQPRRRPPPIGRAFRIGQDGRRNPAGQQHRSPACSRTRTPQRARRRKPARPRTISPRAGREVPGGRRARRGRRQGSRAQKTPVSRHEEGEGHENGGYGDPLGRIEVAPGRHEKEGAHDDRGNPVREHPESRGLPKARAPRARAYRQRRIGEEEFPIRGLSVSESVTADQENPGIPNGLIHRPRAQNPIAVVKTKQADEKASTPTVGPSSAASTELRSVVSRLPAGAAARELAGGETLRPRTSGRLNGFD